MSTSRRDLFKLAGAGAAALAIGGGTSAVYGEEAGASELPLNTAPTEKNGDMFFRTLGKTREKVSLIGLGGFHIGIPRDEQEGIRIIRSAIDRGINFLDNCWDYHEGGSEIRMGKALRDGYRKKAFLMTKIDGQTKAAAEKQLNESLRRLQTDMIDLLQCHEIVRMSDPERIFGPNGAIEALVAARKAGKIRYIGFTGHRDPNIHLHMLETSFKHKFVFDSVQMPLNVMDPHYLSFTKKVLPVLVQHNIAPLAMKTLGAGAFLKVLPTVGLTPKECLRYSMSLPISVLISGMKTMDDLNRNLETARSFRPLNKTEVAAVLAKTAPVASAGKYEWFKHGRPGYTFDHPEAMG
jgi:predicted aldo/keto reductase-like oxidoreductase